jgi:hypothetical protein
MDAVIGGAGRVEKDRLLRIAAPTYARGSRLRRTGSLTVVATMAATTGHAAQERSLGHVSEAHVTLNKGRTVAPGFNP